MLGYGNRGHTRGNHGRSICTCLKQYIFPERVQHFINSLTHDSTKLIRSYIEVIWRDENFYKN